MCVLYIACNFMLLTMSSYISDAYGFLHQFLFLVVSHNQVKAGGSCRVKVKVVRPSIGGSEGIPPEKYCENYF